MAVTTTSSQTTYNVVCGVCGQIFTPTPKSALWWKAKRHDDKGRVDAYECTGEECGCVSKHDRPDTPFRVFGYTDDCRNFDIPFDSFTPAVKKFKEMTEVGMYVVFIDGISDRVRRAIEL